MSVFQQLSDLAVLLHHRCQHNNLSISTNTALFNDRRAKTAKSVLTLLRVRAQHGNLVVILQALASYHTDSKHWYSDTLELLHSSGQELCRYRHLKHSQCFGRFLISSLSALTALTLCSNARLCDTYQYNTIKSKQSPTKLTCWDIDLVLGGV